MYEGEVSDQSNLEASRQETLETQIQNEHNDDDMRDGSMREETPDIRYRTHVSLPMPRQGMQAYDFDRQYKAMP